MLPLQNFADRWKPDLAELDNRSPSSTKSLSFLEAGLRDRQEYGYDETQLGRSVLDMQDAIVDEQSMVIRIKDPVAEAARAQLLKSFQKNEASVATTPKRAESAPIHLHDSETIQSTRRSSRATRKHLRDES